ncbi:DUF423-domain-containing protein [Athelia psychrophila]|uniref:DUF423-domain-containing protein n=1 Tax=Athelia psychrophila TaxID=1759441 RepID=A0A166U202_9AGAM|nr:DUF423-domain-containing protein [Fibularhizoctonia sp. CBS 109695]
MTLPNSSTPLLGGRGFSVGPKLLWRTGAILAAVGMMTGAYGAHGLKKREGITPESVSAFQTAAHYAVFNGLALLAVSLHPRFAYHKFAGPAIALGGLVFSSTIMGLALARDTFKFFGPVTPIGGTIMMAGYLALAF